MDQYLRIEGVHVDLDAISQESPKGGHAKEDKYFTHLPDNKKALAYAELDKALGKYKDSQPKVSVTVEKDAPAPGVVDGLVK